MSQQSLKQRVEGWGRVIAAEYVRLPRIIHLMCVGSLINRIGSFVMLFLTIYISEELGHGEEFAGYCIGASGVGSVLATLIGGQLADEWGRRKLLLLSLWGGGLMLLIVSQVQSAWPLMAALFFFSLLAEMYRPASAAVVADVSTAESRPAAFSLMFLSFNLGFALAPPIGGWLIARSWDWLFQIDALSTMLFGLVIFLFIPETRPDADASSQDPDQSLPGTTLWQDWKIILGDYDFLLFWLFCLLRNIVFMQAFITLPLFLRKLGFSEQEFGAVICLNGVLIVCLQLPCTTWLQKASWLKIMLWGQLLMAIGFGLTAFAAQMSVLVISISLWTVGEILQAPVKPTLVMTMAPTKMRARYMGLFQMSYAVSIALGAPLGGVILTHFGGAGLWGGSAVLLILAGLALIPLHQRLDRRSSETREQDLLLGSADS